MSRSLPPAVRAEHHWVRSGPADLAVSVDRPEGEGPFPAVVIVHGFSGHRLGRSYHFVEFGRMLAASGVACVRFDQAGCGESTGNQLDYGMRSIVRDCRVIREWIDGRADLDSQRVGLLGSSMGALGALAIDAERPALGVALWAPVYDLPALVKNKINQLPVEQAISDLGFAPFRGLRLGTPYFRDLSLARPELTARESDSPVLVFHSRGDEVVTIEHSKAYAALFEGLGRPFEFVEIEQPTHDFCEEPARSQVLGRTASWFVRLAAE